MLVWRDDKSSAKWCAKPQTCGTLRPCWATWVQLTEFQATFSGAGFTRGQFTEGSLQCILVRKVYGVHFSCLCLRCFCEPVFSPKPNSGGTVVVNNVSSYYFAESTCSTIRTLKSLTSQIKLPAAEQDQNCFCEGSQVVVFPRKANTDWLLHGERYSQARIKPVALTWSKRNWWKRFPPSNSDENKVLCGKTTCLALKSQHSPQSIENCDPGAGRTRRDGWMSWWARSADSRTETLISCAKHLWVEHS